MPIEIPECSLAELMRDPMIGLVMKSDGVDRGSLELLLERVSRKRERILTPAFPLRAQARAAVRCTC